RHDFPASRETRSPKVARRNSVDPSPSGTLTIACACGKRPFASARVVLEAHATAMTKAPARLTLFLYLIGAFVGSKGCREEKRVLTTPGIDVTIPPARAAYVTNNGSDTVSVFDRDGDDKVLSVPIDPDPDAHEAPHHITVDGAGGVAFVALA